MASQLLVGFSAFGWLLSLLLGRLLPLVLRLVLRAKRSPLTPCCRRVVASLPLITSDFDFVTVIALSVSSQGQLLTTSVECCSSDFLSLVSGDMDPLDLTDEFA